jgi:SPP1 family phage portal protein
MAYISEIKNIFDINFGNSYREKWNRYLGKYAPIMNKKAITTLKQESQVNISCNFSSEIINLKSGYLASKIQESIITEDQELKDEFDLFLKNNSSSVLNVENCKLSSASGISHRLFYWKDGKPVLKNLYPWEVLYDYDDDIFNPKMAYYFYTKTDLLGVSTYYCDAYDDTFVTHYYSSGANGPFYQVGEPEAHLSNQVPIIPFLNNDNIQGNCDKVYDMIDAYDEIISDFASEIKASRFAYLKIFGDLYTGKDEDGNEIDIPSYLREFGSLIFGTDDEGKPLGDAQFLEKNLNSSSIVSLQDILRKHIFEQADSVDISEITKNGNNSRIFTVKTSLMRLETDCSLTERFIRRALEKQYNLFLNWYSNMFNKYSESSYDCIFIRSFPVDIESIASALVNLKQSMSLEDAYNLLGIENAKQKADRYLQELGVSEGLK